jgi:putative membrane protein
MRYVYVALIVLFTAVVLLFKFQNLETVTVTLLSASVTLPISVLIILVYVLGALTGGFLLAVIRTWVRHASGKSEQ